MRRLVSDLCFTAALLLGIVCAAQAQFNNFPPGVFTGRAALDPAPGGGTPTVAFDAVASNFCSNCAGTTVTWTHTPVGTPTAVAVACLSANSLSAITGVTYGGAAMANAVKQLFTPSGSGLTNSVEIWGLPNPSSGAQSVVITDSLGGSAFLDCGSITVTNSNTSTAFDATNSTTSAATSISTSVTSTVNELAIDVAGGYGITTLAVSGGQTLKWGPLTTGPNLASGSILAGSAGSTTMSWTVASNPNTPFGLAAATFKHQ